MHITDKPVAVLAGTPVDTQMGADVLAAHGIAALNCPVSELCRMAGHNSIETTMLYYINSTETGERAARKALEMLNTNK